MPPNIKFPVLGLGAAGLSDHELIDAAKQAHDNSNSVTAPPPLPLDIEGDDDNDNDDDDETFMFHDIEENVATIIPSTDDDQSNNADLAVGDLPKLEEEEEEEENDNRYQHQVQDHQHQHHQHHQRVIKHLASQIKDPEEMCIDDRRLSRAVRDAGEFSYGVLACEVWLLEDDTLVRPKGGWWHNSKLYQISTSSLLDDLEMRDPDPVLPGVDLPGILWAETVRDIHIEPRGGLNSRSGSFFVGHKSTDDLEGGALAHHHRHHSSILASTASRNHPIGLAGPSMEGLVHLSLHNHNPHALFWRDLRSIAEDPDSAKTERLGRLTEAGLGVAAGVPFHLGNQRGLVIYYARSNAASTTHLISNVANDAFLKASAQMIGHAAALSEVRRASVEARRRCNKDAAERFQRNLMEHQRNKQGFSQDCAREREQDSADDESHKSDSDDNSVLEDLVPVTSIREQMNHGLHSWYHKCKGGNLQVPPSLTFRQSLWTAFGAFCSLLILSSLNEYYKILSDDDYFLLIGPFGALMTLQYGLTAAPASQPRNVIIGQAVSGAVSLAFTYIPESILAVWVRTAVGPAIAIGVMVKCGVTHPPAGAHAVLYASGKYNFGFYALVVLSSAISVIPATIVNNMSSKRQYPTYWTILKLPLRRYDATEKGKE